MVLGVGKCVLFREVSSVQECPYGFHYFEVSLYTEGFHCTFCIITF